MKKILSYLLVAAMVLSLITVPAFAAAADVKVDMVVAEGTLSSKSGVEVELKVATGSDSLVGISYSFVYDPAVFELLDKDGKAVVVGDKDVNHGTEMVVNMPTETGSGFDDTLSYVHVVAVGDLVGVTFCDGSFAGKPLPTATTLNKAFLAFKSGKTVDDVTRGSLRKATAAEAVDTLGEPAVTYFCNTSFEEFMCGTTAGTDTEGWDSNVTFGAGFDFKAVLDTVTLAYSATTVAVNSKDGAKSVAPTLTAKDVDGFDYDTSKVEYAITAPAGATWASVDATGVVTVTKDVPDEGATVTVTASLGGKTATADLTVTKAAPALETIEVTGAATVMIPVDDTAKEERYTVKGYDQYGDEFVLSGAVTATLTKGGTEVTGMLGADYKLTVTKTAEAGDYVITVTNAGKTGTLNVKISNLQVDWTKYTATITYGQAYNEAAAVTAEGQADVKVAGKITLTDTTKPAAGSYDGIAAVFTPDDTKYGPVVGAVKVTVEPKALVAANVKAADTVYTGKAAAPAVEVKDGDAVLVADTDYTVAASTDVNAGAATVKVSGKGNYKGDVDAAFTIAPKALADVTVTAADTTYTAAAATPVVTVKDGTATLVADKDYTVAACTDVNAGAATVKVSGKGNYTGDVDAAFTIQKADLSAMTPALTGGSKVNNTVTAAVEGVAASELTWQWYYAVSADAAMVKLAGETANTLKLTSAMKGWKVCVEAAAVASGNYAGTTAKSAAITVSAASSGSSSRDPERGTSGGGAAVKPEEGSTGTSTTTGKFVDVTENDWFNDVVNESVKAGLIKGIDETHFAPYMNTTRAMVATILWRMAGEPEARIKIADFPDVDADSWYIEAVRWAAEQGIVTGFETGNFGPDQYVTREQLAAMVCRYNTWKTGAEVEDATVTDFVDADAVSEWAVNSMSWAVANGIINGKDGNRLDPTGTATRAEAAAILVRYNAK